MLRNTVMTLICMLFLSSVSLAQNMPETPYEATSEWSLEKDDDGISIHSRSIKNSDFREFRAETTLNTSIDAILAVFHDPSSFTKWVHQCSKAEIIEQPSFLEAFVYQVSDMPLIVSDRDVVIHDIYSYSTDHKIWTIHVEAIEGKVEPTDMIRITNSKGTYKLIQKTPNQVDIIWHQHADPAGALPSWLVNTLIVDLPYQTLYNLRELVKEEKYDTSKIGYNEQGVPDHWAIKNF